MSGPKYSRAEIRELQRLKQLERQLAEELEQSKRRQIISEIVNLENIRERYCGESIISECEKIIPQAEQLIPDSKLFIEMKSLLEAIWSTRDYKCDKSGDSDSLLEECSEFKNRIDTLKNTTRLLKDLKKQISIEGTAALQRKKSDEFLSIEWEDTGERIDTVPKDLQEAYLELIKLLTEMPDYEEKKKLIDNTIMKTGDNEYKKRQLELRKKAIEVERNSSQDNIKMLSLASELRGLYDILGWEAKAIPFEISDMEKALSEAKEEAERRQKNKYIAECIHRVFERKGYALVDDVIMTSNGKQMQKDYYEFGDDSLINVSRSDSGQILFEIVGDGTEDGMNETRAKQLESEMHRFCPNYTEIKQILQEEYGICLEDEHLCEPDKKYAKAVDVTVKKSERRAKKEKKMMHYDD